MKKIILASTSPRRKEIFEKTNLPFSIVESNFEEDMTLDLSPTKLAKYLSLGKAQNVATKYKDAIVIAADSFVVFEKKVLGKPHSKAEAKKMLQMISGKKTVIITGVAIIDISTGNTTSFAVSTSAFLREISESEIDNYILTGEPLDKAGAYAIQGLGAVFVKRIEGDFYSAVGLPLNRIVEELKKFDIHVL